MSERVWTGNEVRDVLREEWNRWQMLENLHLQNSEASHPTVTCTFCAEMRRAKFVINEAGKRFGKGPVRR